MTAPGDLELDGEEGYPVGASVRYFYSLDEYQALERERDTLQERLQQLESELRSHRPWWGKLRALLPGGSRS